MIFSGAVHFTASSNDCGVRDFDMEKFQLSNHIRLPWPVNVSLLDLFSYSSEMTLVSWQLFGYAPILLVIFVDKTTMQNDDTLSVRETVLV